MALFILLAFNYENIQRTVSLLLFSCLGSATFYWGIQNLSFLNGFKNYLEKDGAYGSDGVATQIKLLPFHVIPTHYESGFNWFLGLGPCHTVDRFGGWLVQEYHSILSPLGVTSHPVTGEIWTAVYSNWIAMESTVFSPFFGWAGIWGNLGILGLLAYISLGAIVWNYFCFDALSKFFLISIVLFGFIFTQMEEPGFMLFTVTLLGFRWHENRLILQHRDRIHADKVYPL